MAAKNEPALNEGQQANVDQLAQVEELSDPNMLADVDEPKTHKVKSPGGTVTEVPDSILQPLLDSGYSKSK
jgi:hypothetical protein